MAGPISGSSSGIDPAVLGTNSAGGLGVWGISDSGNGVFGSSNTGTGVVGQSAKGNAGQFEGKVDVTGDLSVGANVAVAGNISTAGNATVKGNLTVTGNLTADDVLLSGKDCAEEFESAGSHALEPGSVVIFDERGAVDETDTAYNTCVAGVISGAGPYRPAVVLGADGGSGATARVALVGRVYCKVDASYAQIKVGDLLTTSPTRGHAMKATESLRALGAVIGKALAPLQTGREMIPILVALR